MVRLNNSLHVQDVANRLSVVRTACAIYRPPPGKLLFRKKFTSIGLHKKLQRFLSHKYCFREITLLDGTVFVTTNSMITINIISISLRITITAAEYDCIYRYIILSKVDCNNVPLSTNVFL